MGLAAALVVVVIAVLAWASIASLSGVGPAGAATAFFRTLADKGAQAAYASTSTTFQQATPADAFAQAVQARGLGDFKSAEWSVRSQGGALAEVDGAVTLKSGAVSPANLRLVKAGAGWQVLSLELPQGGLAGASTTASAAGDGGYDSATGGAPPAQPPYPGAPPQGAPPAPAGAGLLGAAPPPQAGYPGAPAGAPGGSPDGAAMARPQGRADISQSRVARICGKTLMHNSWADTVQLHCPDPIGTEPGATTRCLAIVNGHRTGVTATMERYDPARDDAQLTCRLEG